jgi:hypothetical protein
MLRSVLLASALLLLGAPATALTIALSEMSSEPVTNPAGDLSADVTFSVSGCGVSSCTLTIVLDNRTDENGSGVTYDISQLGFNASFSVVAATDLTFVSATHSTNGDVLGRWTLHEQDLANDPDTHLDGFGIFDFALVTGNGNNAAQAGPGDTITFVFTAPAGISDANFDTLSAQTPSGDQQLKTVTAKFVEMDPVGFSTCGASGSKDCDSAYGGSVPEPATAWLVLAGLAGLACARRRRLTSKIP